MFRGIIGRGNSKIANSLGVTMTLLRGVGITGFMYITYYIANLHPVLFGWNELGKYLPAYIAAASKYYGMTDGLGPYLKIILPEEDTAEFKADKLGVLQTVATAIAKVQGQKTADNIRTAIEVADLSIVSQALEIVRAYGGANTVLTDAVRKWDLDHLNNPELIHYMGQGATVEEMVPEADLPDLHRDNRAQN